jgi:hypothetical protein
MNRKQCFTISFSVLFLIVLINAPYLNAQLYERGWRVGTTLLYSIESSEKEIYEMTNDTLIYQYEYSGHAKIRYNITEIDEINERVRVKEHWIDFGPYSSYYYFNASLVAYEIANNLFYFYYYWDDNLNKAQLLNFNMISYFFTIFIEPDWKAFNEGLKVVLDGNRVIDIVDTGTTFQEIYMDDFLPEISFNINGESTIAEARNSFTQEKSRWRFEFDLSDLIVDRDYNSELGRYEYFQYNRYELIYEQEYTKAGILSKIKESKITSITKDNIRETYEEMYSIETGETGTATIDYEFFSVVLVLVLLPLALVLKRKRK